MANLPPQLWIGVPAGAIALAAMAVAPYWAWPWIAAAALYALFLSHYQNWRGPLTQAEVDDVLKTIQPKNDPDGFRTFLENDDGAEFFMLNLIQFPEGKVAHPDTGEAMEPHKLVENYSKPFIKRLLLRGGHPTMLLMRRGIDIDSWGLTAETGAKWGVTNVMRYRSRRDLAQMASMSDFDGIHRFKREAILETISSPNKMMMAGFAGPRVFAGMALSLAAAFANIAIIAVN